MDWITKNRPTKKQDLVKALDEMSEHIKYYRRVYANTPHPVDFWTEYQLEQIGKLRSLVDCLPADKEV